MTKRHLISILYASLLFCISLPTIASITYQYQGKPFTNFYGSPPASATAISGYINVSTITVDTETALTDISSFVNDFSFTDGFQTSSLANGGILDDAFIRTDSSGNITEWRIDLLGPEYWVQINTSFDPSDTDGSTDSSHRDIDLTLDYFASVENTMLSQGDWAVVPLPGSFLLFASSLLGFMGWRRKR